MTTPRTPGRHRRPARRPRASLLIASAAATVVGVGGWAAAAQPRTDAVATPGADPSPLATAALAAAQPDATLPGGGASVLPLPRSIVEAAPGVGVAATTNTSGTPAADREESAAASRSEARTAPAAVEVSEADLDSGRRAATDAVESAVAEAEAEAAALAVSPAPGHDVTSRYGPRWGRMHEGTDFSVITGTPLLAAQASTVTSATWSDGLGYHVRLETDAGEELVYGHMSELEVEAGQRVETGEQIGLSGNTGRSTGPHLHFEVRVDGVAQDSYVWLSERGAF